MVDKREVVRCECGAPISSSQLSRHRQGAWHRNHAAALELVKLGLSFAEIGRQLGMSRAYVWQKLAQDLKGQLRLQQALSKNSAETKEKSNGEVGQVPAKA